MSTLRCGTPALSPLAFAIILGQLLLPLPMLAQGYQAPSVQIGIKNSGTLYGTLSGYGSLNFYGCTPSGAAPNFTITCNGGESTATSVQEAAEASTPVQSSVGLDTTYLQYYFVPGFTDNATTPNPLYTAMHYAIDDDSQNLYQLQYTNKAIAGIEKGVAGAYFVWWGTGDSDTAGISNATQSVLVEATAMLQGLSGYPGWGYGGPGFLPTSTTKNTAPSGIIQTLSGSNWVDCSWTNGVVSNGHSGACWGPDNNDATDTNPTIGDYYQWASSGAAVFTDCFIYYGKVSGGGSFKSNLDGSDGSTVSTNGSGIGSVACPHGSSGTHTIKAIITTSSSPVTILGAIAVNATGGTGVLVLKMGSASNTAANFATNPNYSALVTQINTDLSGLSNFATGITLFSQQWGANEWSQAITPASMISSMTTLNSSYTGSRANADYLIITDNDDENGGTTNSAGQTLWQYDYAHQQFANANRYGFFSTFRRTYPARTALCGTLHLSSGTCQRMIASQLLQRMLGHTLNPVSVAGTASPNFSGTPTVANLPISFDNYDSGDITYTLPTANASGGTCSASVNMFTTGGQFSCWVDISQTAAYSGCGSAPGLGFALGWTDNYQNGAINGGLTTNNMFETQSNGTSWTTANVAALSTTSSAPGVAQIWTGVAKHVYNENGGQVAYCPVLTNTWTTCTTAPTVKYRMKCKAE